MAEVNSCSRCRFPITFAFMPSSDTVLQREALPYSADRPTCPIRVGEPPRLRMDTNLVNFQHRKTRFGLSLPSRYYLPLPGAPAHPCAKSIAIAAVPCGERHGRRKKLLSIRPEAAGLAHAD
ncbi:hypothetical protein QR685DRAFT_336386 [Neurospora intermedia]|uniref:Uncharacterized protein n=1 Tax=Neurospora intermedia TaxID=5142 RepID=A0ABR3D6H4_NEUIN